MSGNSRVAWRRIQKKMFNMVSVGVVDQPLNQAYDIISTAVLLVNLTATVLMTFDGIASRYHSLLLLLEAITVAFFAVDYVLRLLTARFLYPTQTPGRAVVSYMLSFAGIIDILSFLPYYLPVVFPYGAAVFRIIRVARIMRLFRINAYYDSLNVITEVIKRKGQQLISSVFIILVLMFASSLCMYSLEHEAQPEVFSNAFSGIWWATSTLLTVGYGDIYPITTAGKVAGIIITFLGVGMVAIPTGIISAGFVEQYSKLKHIGEGSEGDIHFIKIRLRKNDAWTDKRVKELGIPHGMIIAAVQRGSETIIPRGDAILRSGDTLVLGAEALKHDKPIELREVVVGAGHEWNGIAVRELDISRQSFIVYIKRNGRTIIPKGDLIVTEGDRVILYTKITGIHRAEDDD